MKEKQIFPLVYFADETPHVYLLRLEKQTLLQSFKSDQPNYLKSKKNNTLVTSFAHARCP